MQKEATGTLRADMDTSLRSHLGRLNHSSLNATLDLSVSSKTPSKNKSSINGRSSSPSNPSNSRTPGSAGRKKTPGKGSKTPKSADRFIPNRSTTQFELAHFKLCQQTRRSDEELAKMSPSEQEYRKIMNENLNGHLMDSKILSFQAKPPKAENCANMRVLYSTGKMYNSSKKTTRYIPQVPERILDAPEILDDFYLQLIDWSKNNILAVALGSSIYLWNAGTGNIVPLLELEGSDYVSCVKWTGEGSHLALGMSNGDVEIWDTEQSKKLRTMDGHSARIGSLSWNSYMLSSGSRSGSIHNHDVRVPNHHISTLQGHTQEVCGLQWSPNGNYLASGGNDNQLHIWRSGAGSLTPDTQPVYTFSQHQAAIKALSWCPWQRNVLASGGGTADRFIRLWNCNNGANLQAFDTHSQVCALLWSEEHKELISGHGFSQNQLAIWKYPTMSKVAELTGHTARILHMCLSPDGTTVVSAGADETLRLWKCFQVDEKAKKTKIVTDKKKQETSSLRFEMR